MKIAQSVTAAQQSQLLASSFEITASPMPGHTLDEILAVIDEEIAGAAGQAAGRGGAGPRQEPARVGHRPQPREPARARRAAAVLQLPGRRSRLRHRGSAPLPRRRRRRHPARRPAVPEEGRARRRDHRSESRRADHGTDQEMTAARIADPARRAWRLALSFACASAPPPATTASAASKTAAAPPAAAPSADSGATASAVPGRETPDAPFRQLAPPARPGADLQAAQAEALQAEERPRGVAGRIPRPAARRLQPDDQDRRRRQPARSRRAGRSHRAHARRGDEDAQRARHRRADRVARRDAVDGQHLGRVERQPVDADQEPGRGAEGVRRRRREPGLRPQGVRARPRQPADRDHAPQGQPADGRQPGVHAPAVRRRSTPTAGRWPASRRRSRR